MERGFWSTSHNSVDYQTIFFEFQVMRTFFGKKKEEEEESVIVTMFFCYFSWD